MKNLTIEKQTGSTVLIKGELPWEDFKTYQPKALKALGEVLSVDGFRKGHIPDDIIIKNAGENAVLEEMAQLAFQAMYPEIITEHKIDAIGRPSIQITKLAKDNPLGFSITTSVMPVIKLPDFKSIAKEINKTKESVEVTEEDVQNTIEEIRTMRAKQDLFKKMQDGTHESGATENNKDESPEDVQKRIDEKLELPEWNNDFVKSLGDFASIEDFTEKLKENLAFEKTRKAGDKQRIAIMEGILEKTELDIPTIIVDSEIDQMMFRMKTDVEAMGMKFDEYLTRLGKSEDTLREESRKDAEKRASIQMVIATIAREADIHPDHDQIHKEMDVLKEKYPEAEDHSLHSYVETILTNDLVFKMLESQ